MEKFEIVINLEHVAASRKAWNEAAKVSAERVDRAMKRLIHEAAAARMSATEVAKLSAFSTAQIKQRMKTMGLNPTTGKTLLSRQAAAVLESNAEIMGIQPHEIDLMSPLAYLPAGSLLKETDQSVHSLRPHRLFPETVVADMMTKAYSAGWSHRTKEVDFDPVNTTVEIMAEADEAGA